MMPRGLTAMRAIAFICLFHAISYGSTEASAPVRIFRMEDPVGDDRGDGMMTYPQDRAFHPYHSLLDLTLFDVKADDEYVYFDLTFGAVANPWHAPEGFFHPRIDIFIHTGSRKGAVEPLRNGPGVRFTPRYPWHVWVKIAPFGGTALFTHDDPPESIGVVQGVEARRLDGEPVIQVRVNRHHVPTPSTKWRYYVFVGSFDGFGEDGYRHVGDGRWLLGHPEGGNGPRIVDMLAPRRGAYRQEKQLKGTVPVVHPVGPQGALVSGRRLIFGIVSLGFLVFLVRRGGTMIRPKR